MQHSMDPGKVMHVTGAGPSLTRNFLAWFTRDKNVRMLEPVEALQTWSLQPGVWLPEDPQLTALLIANTEPVRMATAHLKQAHQWLTDTQHLWKGKSDGLLLEVKNALKEEGAVQQIRKKLGQLLDSPESHRTDALTDLQAKGWKDPIFHELAASTLARADTQTASRLIGEDTEHLKHTLASGKPKSPGQEFSDKVKKSEAGTHLHHIREEFQKTKAFMKSKAEGLNPTTQAHRAKASTKPEKAKGDNTSTAAQYQKGTAKGSLKRKKQDLEESASKPGNQELKTKLAGVQDMQSKKEKASSLRQLHEQMINRAEIKVSHNPKRKGANRERYVIDFSTQAWIEKEKAVDLAALKLAGSTSAQYSMYWNLVVEFAEDHHLDYILTEKNNRKDEDFLLKYALYEFEVHGNSYDTVKGKLIMRYSLVQHGNRLYGPSLG